MKLTLVTAAAVVLAASSGLARPPAFVRLGATDTRGYSNAIAVSADGLTAIGQNGFGGAVSFGTGALSPSFDPKLGLADFQFLLGSDYLPYAVSADASIVVGSRNNIFSSGSTTAFRWTASGSNDSLFHDLASFASDIRATAVSGDGSVVAGNVGSQAVRWTASGGTAPLGVVPGFKSSTASGISGDGSTVTGNLYHQLNFSSLPEAYVWQGSGMAPLGFLPGGIWSEGHAVSGDGRVVVGVADVGGGQKEAFRWTLSGGMVPIGPAGSNANATNADGSVIVGNSPNGAFIWTVQGGYEDLRTFVVDRLALLPPIQYPLQIPQLVTAVGISADGMTFVGADGTAQAYAVTIPEPSSLLLGCCAAGILGLATFRKWRARRRPPISCST